MLTEKQNKIVTLYLRCEDFYNDYSNAYNNIYKEASEEVRNSYKYSFDEIISWQIRLQNDENSYKKLKPSFSFEESNVYKEFVLNKKNVENDLNKIDFLELYYNYFKNYYELERLCVNNEKYNNENEEKTYDFLYMELNGNDYETINYSTSILDNYMNCGVNRICIDGIQNHLPEFSKGSVCLIQFFIDNRWVNIDEAKNKKEQITKVRFVDDGIGFENKNLQFLSSQKSSKDRSAVQFEENLKIIAMTSINADLGLEIQSKNWAAEVYSEDEQHGKLCWKVKEFDGELIKGSRTIFNKPSKDLIEFVFKLPEYVLELSNEKPKVMNDRIEIYDNSKERFNCYV